MLRIPKYTRNSKPTSFCTLLVVAFSLVHGALEYVWATYMTVAHKMSFINSIHRNNVPKQKFSKHYIDTWYTQTIKDPSFYETFASTPKHKCYFYTIDLQGRLYLEDTTLKNIATSLKDTRFLNFFFSRIRHVDALKDGGVIHKILSCDADSMVDIIMKDYPFVSPCGKELNFIRPADTPIVFHDLQQGNLFFGGSLSQPYNPQQLAISKKTRRLYHKLTNDGKKLTPLHQCDIPEYGLIKSSVAITISDFIVKDEGNDSIICEETGDKFPLKWLPYRIY